MKRLIILTDESLQFLISIPDLKNYISMDINKIKNYFTVRDYHVDVMKFSSLDLTNDFKGIYIIYQTSETPGAYYKRYIEDLVYFLEQKGAIMMPRYELLKAHHNKVFMELMRSRFTDKDLRSVRSRCYGSWVDAMNYDLSFPAVVKQSSSSGSAGVFLARNRKEYEKIVKKAGRVVVGTNLSDIFIHIIKIGVKKLIKFIDPSKTKYLDFNTTPVSASIIVQPFIDGLHGDYKVLIFGSKYYTLYRQNRENDFRASGSGRFFDVPLEAHQGLLDFAMKITSEIDFPIFGMDIASDNSGYHLLEFQVIHMGTPPLQRSKYWHEFHDGKWIKFDGTSDLEEEFSRSIHEYINVKHPDYTPGN
jgi:glutathione synthase/RimK-type ligase-like ATP-grasp enzyme